LSFGIGRKCHFALLAHLASVFGTPICTEVFSDPDFASSVMLAQSMEDGMAYWLPVVIGVVVAIGLAFAVAFGAFSKKHNA